VTPLLTNALRTAAISVLLSSRAASTGAILPLATLLSMVDLNSRASAASTPLVNGTCLLDGLSGTNAFPEALHRSRRIAPRHRAMISLPSLSIL